MGVISTSYSQIRETIEGCSALLHLKSANPEIDPKAAVFYSSPVFLIEQTAPKCTH